MDQASSEDCITFDNLKEIVHTAVHRDSREDVGTHVDFHDDLFDSANNKIGSSVGIAVVFANPEDGSLMQLASATDHLPDGTIAWTGTYPMDPIDRHHSVLAVGTSGRYLGKVGTRSFRYVDRPNDSLTILQSSIVLHSA